MSILPESNYEKIHTGSAIETQRLQAILEERGIPSILRNDNESATLGGYALGSPDNSRLLVQKEYVIKAKHIVTASLQEFESNQISEDELNNLSQEAAQKPIINTITRKQEVQKKPEITSGFMLLYVLFLGYSLWRLSPLLQGEEVPIYRIIISGGLSIFCIYRIATYFKNKREA